MMQTICYRCREAINLNDCVMVVDADNPIGIAAHKLCTTDRDVIGGMMRAVQSQTLRAYICGTDWQCEMNEPNMLGECRITPNIDYAQESFGCMKECGLAEVELRFVRWVIEPESTDGT